ncbi:MtnX-like HAD-IB family phosphatase [Candidatus Latescibacterota bacterium]
MTHFNIKLFVDFDGTVTEKDVGDGIFKKFMLTNHADDSLHEKLIEDWKAGRLSSEECLTRECAHLVMSEEEFQAELDEYALTPGFTETAEYCMKNNIPIMILSDGLDYYIKYLLEKYGLGYIPFFSNHMYFKNGGVSIEFPYIGHGCRRCGNCKRWHIIKNKNDGDCVVYIGDGYSDRFAIKSSDVVFARNDLAEYCMKNNHTFLPFKDFYSILTYLEKLNDQT